MTWHAWTLFAALETVLCLTPGPAVLLVLAHGIKGGWRGSLASNLGILAGNGIYFALTATGLGAAILASYELFFAIKWVGAAYLVWLGLAAFFGKSTALSVDGAAGGGRFGRRLANGVVLQLSNPKALLFFAALLPQFIDPAAAVAPQVAILGLTSAAIEFVVLGLYGGLAGRARRLAARPRWSRLADRFAGLLLVTAGIGMAALRRS
jgi:threonine/homoserine/homoserine lactone efflux protein